MVHAAYQAVMANWQRTLQCVILTSSSAVVMYSCFVHGILTLFQVRHRDVFVHLVLRDMLSVYKSIGRRQSKS